MSHRQPRLKDQARAVRETLHAKGIEFGVGESLELVARLNGFPSWNVAKKTDKDPSAKPSTTLKFELWTAVHHHRHGEDLFFFTHHPSEAEVIERINCEGGGWEPEDNESIEVRGVDRFDIDVPLELAKAAEQLKPAGLIGVYELCMLDLFEYDAPDSVPEWQWVESNASFQHRGNGTEGGVWEFMVHLERVRNDLASVPVRLRAEVAKALELNAVWMMFHQG